MFNSCYVLQQSNRAVKQDLPTVTSHPPPPAAAANNLQHKHKTEYNCVQ